ncbi:DNA damage-binding protein 1a [Psilocybe cubensis]|uniref:DNA damage-binding protein 1 n=2 Tax=Psilocybe cubensis TaxID=181762 RepID=A0A8H7XQ31_PSICU|nr:DNA damage-binding protein 1a [Psilocybe cubensis]KAH9480543.1 DNA damage-binding protein 1a [Psilocybe cubensis]
MKVVSTFLQSSSVVSSVKCRLASRDLEYLVVAKLNQLSVYSLRPHGLQHECTLNIWGKICSVKALPLSDSGYDTRSNIALMITHPEPELIILAYREDENGEGKLVVNKQISLYERLPRVAEFFTDFLVHPSGRLVVVSCYASKLKIVTFKGGNYQQDFDVSLPEINVFSYAFLPTLDDEYALAILHFDFQERLQLCARDIDLDAFELSAQFSILLQPTVISDKVVPSPLDSPPRLIPVPPTTTEDGDIPEDAFLGGILVVGGKQIALYELASKESQEKERGKLKRLDSKKKSNDAVEVSKARTKEMERANRRRKATAMVDWPWSEITAWCNVDGTSRFLIGDYFGRLSMLSLDNIKEWGMILIPLGETSQATTLTYLTNQSVYVGSHAGDSQLLCISETPTTSNPQSTLVTPPEIAKTTPDNLTKISSKKGKQKALPDDSAMDVDDEQSVSAPDYAKGRVVAPQGSFIKILETYKNISPILDAISVDTDGIGQNQIVTCSGLANTGAINIVRNGADFKALGFVPGVLNITRIWSARTDRAQQYDTHLLASTVNETHWFSIHNSPNLSLKFEEETTLCLKRNLPTLAFANFSKRNNGGYIDSGLFVQVVPTGAFLFEWDPSVETFIEKDSWEVKNIVTVDNRPLEIVSASVNSSQVGLALSGGKLVILCIETGALRFRKLMDHVTHSEISAITFLPLDPTKKFSTYLTVAYWGSNVIQVFALREGRLVTDQPLRSPPLPAVVRSLLLYNFGTDTSAKGADYHPYLLAGLGNGSVATLHWKGGVLQDLKVISLGNAPVNLTPCEVDGKKTVFAAGNQATVFFCDKNRLTNSAIMLKAISAASSFNTGTFGKALVLAAPTGLFIGCIKDLDKLHIRSFPLGLYNPRRITHESSLKAFGVACTRTVPYRLGNIEPNESSFHLYDDTTLSELGRYNCDTDEEITSVASLRIQVQGEEKPLFCLGTMIYKSEENEPSVGRLLVFTAYTPSNSTKTSTLELSLLASTKVEGCVYALSIVNGKLVAAVNSSIVMYHVDVTTEDVTVPTYSLKKLAEWNHNYLVTSLGTFNNRVVAGDHISSVSMLKVEDNKLLSEARDYGPLYPLCVEALDESNVIASNDTLNFVLFKLVDSLRGKMLETVGLYHVGDMVSKFIRGSLSTTEQSRESMIKPEVIFFTASGKIGVISDVEDHTLSLHLTELQRNLASALPGVGNQSHTRFRAPKNTRGLSDSDTAAYGFVDGDFLEEFLGVLDSPDILEKVMKGGSAPEKLKLTSDEIIKILQQLQSLH